MNIRGYTQKNGENKKGTFVLFCPVGAWKIAPEFPFRGDIIYLNQFTRRSNITQFATLLILPPFF